MAIVLISAVLLTSCQDAKRTELQLYKDNMTAFFENITALNTSINAIDKNAGDATDSLLSCLDALNQEFATLSTFPVPDEFSSISDMTVDAADSMQKAVELYHKAYDGAYDAAAEADAYSYYERANRCIRVIRQVLNGEEPSVEGVTYQQ